MKRILIIEVNRKTNPSDLIKEQDLDGVFDEFVFREDQVGYGIEETFIAGFLFVFSAVASGIIWDSIKLGVMKVYNSLKDAPKKVKDKDRSILFEIRIIKEDELTELVVTIPQSEFSKLETILDEMEEKSAIKKSEISGHTVSAIYSAKNGKLIIDDENSIEM